MPGALETFEVALDGSISSTFDTLRKRLREILAGLKEEAGVVSYDSQNMADLDAAIRAMRAEFESSGGGAVADELHAALEAVRDEVLEEAGDLGLSQVLSGPTNRMVSSLYGQIGDEITGVFEHGAEQIKSFLSSTLMGGVRTKELYENIAKALDSTMAQAKTVANTSLFTFHRQVFVTHAKENGLKEFYLEGPSDGLTRLWCQHWVGRRDTTENIEATNQKWGHAKHPIPAMAWGGGWNCRHRWRPVIGTMGKRYKKGPRRLPNEDLKES